MAIVAQASFVGSECFNDSDHDCATTSIRRLKQFCHVYVSGVLYGNISSKHLTYLTYIARRLVIWEAIGGGLCRQSVGCEED